MDIFNMATVRTKHVVVATLRFKDLAVLLLRAEDDVSESVKVAVMKRMPILGHECTHPNQPA